MKGVKYYSERRLWKAYIAGKNIGWFKLERHAQLARLLWEPDLTARKVPKDCLICGDQFIPHAVDTVLCRKKSCFLARLKQKREERLDEINTHRMERYYSNRTSELAKRKVYTEKNRSRLNAQARKWAKEHPIPYSPEAYRRRILTFTASRHKYRSRLLSLEGGFTKQDLAIMFSIFQQMCVGCNQRFQFLTVDHKVPVSRGGTNYPDNLQPLCKRCNSAKNDKTMFAAQRISDRAFYLAEWREPVMDSTQVLNSQAS